MKLVALASLLAIGCSSSVPGGDGDDIETVYGEGMGTPENPAPQQAEAGPYKLTTTVDFTIEAILPPQLALVVATLRAFEENPASALFDVAEEQGVPAVGLIRGALPGVLEDKLYGWINEYIEKVKINGRPINEYAGEMANYAEIALTQFAVESELQITGHAAVHRITALDLTPAGLDFRLPIDGLAGDILTQNPSITLGGAGALGFDEQHFGLNYGEYAWQGIEHLSTTVTGHDVRGTLGSVIDCDALARTIADKCVLGACVGHETELESICTGGLDAIVDFAHERMASHRLEALHLATGDAILVDDDQDGVGDRIINGTWDAELNIGLGLRYAPAEFAGAR